MKMIDKSDLNILIYICKIKNCVPILPKSVLCNVYILSGLTGIQPKLS